MAAGHSVDVAGWQHVLDEVLAGFAGRFVRVETRRAAAGFVTGLLADLEVKTSWQLAEYAGHARPDAMQRLLYRAVWDADTVRDDVRALVVQSLGDPDGVLVPDDTGDVKKGTHTVGVQRQYTRTAGRIENAQVAVFMTYAGRRGHTLIDRRLYLPVSWSGDPGRMRTAGVPEQIGFAKRWELAADMITAAVDAQVPARWVAADEAYGNSGTFRSRLRDLRLGYVLAVSCDHHAAVRHRRCGTLHLHAPPPKPACRTSLGHQRPPLRPHPHSQPCAQPIDHRRHGPWDQKHALRSPGD
ncbi:IS701 family transposase [Streptomyces sp. NBC_00024]|uniref:IS701 family transposase n=1 Tax=Streptomyces sp. NBC_00024 TaxID=2903612 RepID=UPI00324AC3C5